MGKGNCGAFGKYEGQWYIDWDLLSVYSNKETDESRILRDIEYAEMQNWEFCQFETDDNYEMLIEDLRTLIPEKFSSFSKVDRWISDGGSRCDRKAILENDLFFIALEDNEWCVSVELIQKGVDEYAGLQAKHHGTYLEGIKNIILDMFGEVSYRKGAWMSGTIKKTDMVTA